VQQVRRQQDAAAAVGEAAQQAPHPADAGGVQAVGRLVQDQHLGVPQQRVRDAESLAHAQGVVADAPPGLLGGEADQAEHLVDPGGAAGP
jgi:hypothetical protein